MRRRFCLRACAGVAAAVLLAGCTSVAEVPGATAPVAVLEGEVLAAERAFAATMAERDHAAFTRLLADEAVFFTNGEALRGREAVSTAWQPFFEGAEAPFAWQPDTVEVLESGTLAFSSGPVVDPSGREVARFNSVWRREGPGVCRVVFDKGNPVCPPRPAR